MAETLETEGLIDLALRKTIENYNESEPGSKESCNLCDCICKLSDTQMKYTRLQSEFDERTMKILAEKQKAKDEDENRKAKDKSEKVQFWVDKGVKVGLACASIAYSLWQNTVGMEYERTGYVKSATVRDIIRQTKPRIKIDV